MWPKIRCFANISTLTSTIFLILHILIAFNNVWLLIVIFKTDLKNWPQIRQFRPKFGPKLGVWLISQHWLVLFVWYCTHADCFQWCLTTNGSIYSFNFPGIFNWLIILFWLFNFSTLKFGGSNSNFVLFGWRFDVLMVLPSSKLN